MPRVERAVSVEEAHVRSGGGGEPGEAGRPESGDRLAHNERSVRRGHRSGVVRGVVVDDDRPIPLRHTSEKPRQVLGLIERGNDHVDEGRSGVSGHGRTLTNRSTAPNHFTRNPTRDPAPHSERRQFVALTALPRLVP